MPMLARHPSGRAEAARGGKRACRVPGRGPRPPCRPDRRATMKTALLLIAHGSRHAEANADLHHVAGALRQRGWEIVVPSFLELADPAIIDGGRACVAAGAQCVLLVPYFLS